MHKLASLLFAVGLAALLIGLAAQLPLGMTPMGVGQAILERAPGSDLLFPLLLTVGFYIVLHGHLTPGGGFQGGVVLAGAFFVSFLARPSRQPSHVGIVLIEALAGAAFIGIGLAALFGGGAFLQPLLDKGTLGQFVSAGSLPLLYLAVGLKVGAELSGLLAHLAE
jgi:multicomponent Na+:H+ antiporter subunit B